MSSLAISGMGVVFERWDTVLTSWTAISEIISINGPDKSRGTIKVTSLSSEGGYEEFITGMRDGGTVKLGMNFRRDTFDLMSDDFEDDTLQTYRIRIPDADLTTLVFAGLVTENPLAITTDNQITADVTIKVSGPVARSSGASSGI